MTHNTKASQLPGDEPRPEPRDYSKRGSPQIKGNDELLRLHKPKPEETGRTARDIEDEEIQEFTLERDDNRPLRFHGRIVGFNDIDPEAPRGTAVAVFVTRRGKIITSVHQWQRDAKRERQRHAAAAHEKPEDALEWLIRDGGGHLGRSSREAWERACTRWAPLQGHEVEVVE